MRSPLLFITLILLLSGCSTIVAVAEKEQKAAEKLYIAETLCMKYREFGNGVDYNLCIENVLGVDQKSAANDAIRADNPVAASGPSPHPLDCTPIPKPVLTKPEDICHRYAFTEASPKFETCKSYAEGTVLITPEYSVLPQGCKIASDDDMSIMAIHQGSDLFNP